MVHEIAAAAVAYSPPWWLPPALTGAFVLAAAFIALGSLWLSDYRKLRREDRRQWDREMKDSYVAIATELDPLVTWLWSAKNAALDIDDARERVTAVAAVVRHHAVLLQLTAPLTVMESINGLHTLLSRAIADLDVPRQPHTSEGYWAAFNWGELDRQVVRLHLAVESALRLRRTKMWQVEFRGAGRRPA